MHICIMRLSPSWYHIQQYPLESRRWLSWILNLELDIIYMHCISSSQRMQLNTWRWMCEYRCWSWFYHCFLKWVVLMDSTIYKLTNIFFATIFLLCGVGWGGYCSFLRDLWHWLSWQELAGELLQIWTEYKFLKFH